MEFARPTKVLTMYVRAHLACVVICGCAMPWSSHGARDGAVVTSQWVPNAVTEFSHKAAQAKDDVRGDEPAGVSVTPISYVEHDESATNEGGNSTTMQDRPSVSLNEGVSPGDAAPVPALDAETDIPIDLAEALVITAGQNPHVGFFQQRVDEAYAQLRRAEVLWVPSIRAGVNYNKHDGVIQDVGGKMVTNSRSSVYTGLGAQAVGAGSPAVPGVIMSFHMRDAIFQPRIARHTLGARQYASQAAINDALLETALRYMDLLEAKQILAVAQATVEHVHELTDLTESFARSGQGLQADADRASAELTLRKIEARRAEENVHVATVRLARALGQQDASRTLAPQEPAIVPIELVSPDSHLPDLVATGLSQRPELAASHFLVGEAVQRLRRECYAPLLPSVLLGLSYGGNGGSPTSAIVDFKDRIDFDAAAYWELRNFGLGEQAARNEMRAQVEQASWKQIQTLDQVAAEVAEAFTQVVSRRGQIELAQEGIQAAEDSYRRNLERIQNGQGLPIETLQSIQALDQARRQYVRAVADYNRAQFQLHRALGWPVSAP